MTQLSTLCLLVAAVLAIPMTSFLVGFRLFLCRLDCDLEPVIQLLFCNMQESVDGSFDDVGVILVQRQRVGFVFLQIR